MHEAIDELPGYPLAGKTVIMCRIVAEALDKNFARLARRIEDLEAELQHVRQASVETMLGQLRLREAVLLYVGRDPTAFTRQVGDDFGADVERAISDSLFVLDNAPVSPEVRESIRKATDRGMRRW